jgi:hypothetical protein
VRLPRLLVTTIYIGYLVQVGLLMVILPWSDVWRLLITMLPLRVAYILDAPAARGAITGFGALHLLMVVAEVVYAGQRDHQRLASRGASGGGSQQSGDPSLS